MSNSENTCCCCGETKKRLMTCSGCRTVQYCSKSCQRRHWAFHKPKCKKAQQEQQTINEQPQESMETDSSENLAKQDIAGLLADGLDPNDVDHFLAHRIHHEPPPSSSSESRTDTSPDEIGLQLVRGGGDGGTNHNHHHHHHDQTPTERHRHRAVKTPNQHNNQTHKHHKEHGSRSSDLERELSEFDENASRLQEQAELIQQKHDSLQKDLNDILNTLTENFRRWDIPLPNSLRRKDRDISVLKSPQNMKSLVERCKSKDEETRLLATKECRKLLSDQNPPIAQLVEMGLVPVFINFLKDDHNPLVQFEAAWVITNICSGSSEQTKAVIDAGGVPILIRLLSANEDLAEQCVWALGNIAADSFQTRNAHQQQNNAASSNQHKQHQSVRKKPTPGCDDPHEILLEAGIIEALIPHMDCSRITMIKNLSWTMSNLCNNIGPTHWDKVKAALPHFAQLIYCKDEEILKDVCWTLSYLSNGTKDRIQAIVGLKPSICHRLVDLLAHQSPSVQHAALTTVGNIVTGDDDQTQILIDHGLLPRLRRLVSHSKKIILKDACFTISNIAAGNQMQIHALIEAHIIPALVLLFDTPTTDEIKLEACWALANALSNGRDEHIRYLVHQGVIDPLTSILADTEDALLLEPLLEGFEHILRVGSIDLFARGDLVNYFYKFFVKANSKKALLRLKKKLETKGNHLYSAKPNIKKHVEDILSVFHNQEKILASTVLNKNGE